MSGMHTCAGKGGGCALMQLTRLLVRLYGATQSKSNELLDDERV